MALPASTTSLPTVLYETQNLAQGMRAVAQGAVTTLAAQNVDAVWVFNFLDRFYSLGLALSTWAATPGLDEFAIANVKMTPPYAGSYTADINATIAAAQACVNWVVTNFPKDSTNTYILAFVLNANGSRTPAQFTPAQTVGLRTALNAFIATIA